MSMIGQTRRVLAHVRACSIVLIYGECRDRADRRGMHDGYEVRSGCIYMVPVLSVSEPKNFYVSVPTDRTEKGNVKRAGYIIVTRSGV